MTDPSTPAEAGQAARNGEEVDPAAVHGASANGNAPLPAQTIGDLDQLFPRQTSPHEYRVLSLTNDSPTVYQVDIDAVECSCPDDTYRQEEPHICKHLAAALYYQPATRSWDDTFTRDLAQQYEEVADRLLSVCEAVQQQPQAAPASTGADTPPADTSDTQATAQATQDFDMVSATLEWLTVELGWANDADVREQVHDGTAGVAVECDKRDAGSERYNQWKDFMAETDEAVAHVGFGDATCNTCGESDGEYYYHLPETFVREVA